MEKINELVCDSVLKVKFSLALQKVYTAKTSKPCPSLHLIWNKMVMLNRTVFKCHEPLGIMPTPPSMASAALVLLVGGMAVTPSLPSHTQP